MPETDQINMEIIVDYCTSTPCDWIQVKTTEGHVWDSDFYRVQVAGICPACGKKTKRTIIKRTYEPPPTAILMLTDAVGNGYSISSEDDGSILLATETGAIALDYARACQIICTISRWVYTGTVGKK